MYASRRQEASARTPLKGGEPQMLGQRPAQPLLGGGRLHLVQTQRDVLLAGRRARRHCAHQAELHWHANTVELELLRLRRVAGVAAVFSREEHLPPAYDVSEWR